MQQTIPSLDSKLKRLAYRYGIDAFKLTTCHPGAVGNIDGTEIAYSAQSVRLPHRFLMKLLPPYECRGKDQGTPVLITSEEAATIMQNPLRAYTWTGYTGTEYTYYKAFG
jgi:hypothetical protein